jgi:hypothetical protein
VIRCHSVHLASPKDLVRALGSDGLKA